MLLHVRAQRLDGARRQADEARRHPRWVQANAVSLLQIHRFLTGGPRGPWRGSRLSTEDINVQYYNINDLYLRFWGPQGVNLGELGVHEDDFIILRVHRTKKLRTTAQNGQSPLPRVSKQY